jgi:hypothetical protein
MINIIDTCKVLICKGPRDNDQRIKPMKILGEPEDLVGVANIPFTSS